MNLDESVRVNKSGIVISSMYSENFGPAELAQGCTFSARDKAGDDGGNDEGKLRELVVCSDEINCHTFSSETKGHHIAAGWGG